MPSFPREATLRDIGHAKLAAFCDALGAAKELGTATKIFNMFSATWGDRTLSLRHPASDITDDGSPFEFSLALEAGRPELRMLAEAQGEPCTPAANWEVAWRLTKEIGQAFDVSIARAEKIADLFRPNEETSVFSLWHAACLRAGEAPDFKLYFNPFAQGAAQVEKTMREALARLGQAKCYEWIRQHAMLRGELDQFVYLSLDLRSDAQARTKVYIAHKNALASEVEQVMAAVPGHAPGDAVDFCNAMAPNHQGRFEQRPLLTCMAFVGDGAQPTTVTLHLPIRCYAKSDQEVLDRICALLSPTEAQLYAKAVRGMASRPLAMRTGLQTYISFRRVQGRKRLTAYLSPEIYSGT